MPVQNKPAPGETPLVSLAGADAAEPTELPPLDRSTVEDWAKCPAMARLKATGNYLTSSIAAESGTAVHKAYADAIEEYVNSGGNLTQRELSDYARSMLALARPDVQKEAIEGGKRGTWAMAGIVRSVDVSNIVGWEKQLAESIPKFGVTLTGCLDLLLTETPTRMVIVDWKSGRVAYGGDSFQMDVYVRLVFANYPDVEAIRVEILGTRTSKTAWPVVYYRNRMMDANARIESALEQYRLYRNAEKPPTWPTVEKCEWCPCAVDCPAAGKIVSDIEADPVAWVQRIDAMQTTLKAMEKAATAYADKNGEIDAGGGLRHGRGKPKAERKQSGATYRIPQPKGE